MIGRKIRRRLLLIGWRKGLDMKGNRRTKKEKTKIRKTGTEKGQGQKNCSHLLAFRIKSFFYG